MKKVLIFLILVILSHTINAQFINTQTIGSNSTLFKSKGGLAADSVMIWLNSYPDTTAANLSVASKYNSIIRVGLTYWYRTLSPNKWNSFASGVTGGFVPNSDTAAILAGYKTFYPRTAISGSTGITYSSSTGVVTNSLPDQTVVLTNGTGITITGTYPNFTINNTLPSSGGTLTSLGTNNGTGINGGTITTTGTLAIDTLNLSTRKWRQKGIDSVMGQVATKIGFSDSTTILAGRWLPNRSNDSILVIRTLANTKIGFSDSTTILAGRWLPNRSNDSATALQSRIQTKQPLGAYITLADSTTILAGRWLPNRSNDSATALQSRIQTKQPLLTLTTTGTSGVSTLTGSTLNIPNYTLAGLGGLSTATAATTYVPYSGANAALNLGSQNLYGAATWENSSPIYSTSRFQTAGNFRNDTDSSGLFNFANNYRFYAVAASLNAWYTPQGIVADKFVKIGGTAGQYLMGDGTTTTGTGGAIDTGRAVSQIATGGSLNKVRDSITSLFSSATYTPTLATTTNITSISLYNASYIRVGNIVTVSIGCLVTPTTANTNSAITIDLPITTATATQTVVGSGLFYGNNGGGDFARSGFVRVTTTTAAVFYFYPNNINAGSTSITFQYQIN